jgi:hypothetical protein
MRKAMAEKRFTPEETRRKLRHADVLFCQGRV